MKFLVVDGSYYVFYRFHAMKQWWGNAHRDEDLGIPIENEVFVQAFKRSFIKKFREISKKLKLENAITLVGKDCPRKDIWRMDRYPAYKANRPSDANDDISPFFALAYESLFQEATSCTFLAYPRLEADDCIAITVRHIISTYEAAEVYVVTSDMDFLQLASERVRLYNLKFKNLLESRTAYPEAQKNLFCKILTGDKSDNILPIYKGCGAKTACTFYDHPPSFAEKMGNEEIKERFEQNCELIDFDRIPADLVLGFRTTVLNL